MPSPPFIVSKNSTRLQKRLRLLQIYKVCVLDKFENIDTNKYE
jgi:hypothetical protein